MKNLVVGWPLIVVLLFTSYALLGYMMFWSLDGLSDMAGGLVMFDLRAMGYNYAEANDIVTALGQDGRDFYQNTQLWLDTIFPALSGVAYILLFIKIANYFKFSIVITSLLLIAPFLGSAFDYLENFQISQMLEQYNDLPESTVNLANIFTLLKSAFSTIASITSIVLLASFVRSKINKKLNAV